MKINVQFAGTVTLFPYPKGFTSFQSSLYDQVIAWLNDHCFENPEWDGEDCYKDFDFGDAQVFEKIKELCASQGASFYWTPLGETKYKIGVVQSSQLSWQVPVKVPATVG